MTSPATLEAAGVELAYEDHGAGPPLVLVHGTTGTRAIWRETLDALGAGFRTIAYDRRGYGDSGAPEPYTGTTVGEQADDLAALIRTLDAAPALVCGHSFGALAALEVLRSEPELARAAVLIEPPLLWLTPAGSEAASELREAIEAGARERGADGAVDAFVTGTGGPDALELLGADRVEAAHAAPRAFAADVGAVSAWAVSPRELRAIETPVILLAGTRTPRAWREPSDALADMLPNAELRECDSSHLIPVEAPADVAAAIRALAAQP